MKNLILNIYSKLGIKSDRTKNIANHIGWSMFYKAGSVIANFMLVPLTINYLDNDNYGVWLTLSSFIIWFSFFDIGLGNGLRNKFAEAKSKGNLKEAQAYVSTAYFTIGIISAAIVLLFFLVSQFVDWTKIFNANSSSGKDLSILLPIVFAFFGLQLVLKLIVNLYQAAQNHSINDKIQFFGQFFSLIIIWFLTMSSGSSLLLFGIMFSLLPTLILIGFNVYGFNKTFKQFKPKFKFWKKKYFNEITGLGFSFFVTKIGALVLLSTDSFIIAQLFGPSEVVPYSIAFKYFSIVTIGYGVIVNPYWSSFTEAYAIKDFDWIKKSVKNIQKIWLLIPLGLIVMLMLSSWFYNLWIGNKVVIPYSVTITMALYALLYTYNQIYNHFINGVGKIKLHLYISVLIIVINIPLSIFLAKNIGLGLPGVMLGSCFCLAIKSIVLPMQYHKLINSKARGVWNK